MPQPQVPSLKWDDEKPPAIPGLKWDDEPPVHEKRGALQGLWDVSGGMASDIAHTVNETGKNSYEKIKKGDYYGAFHDVFNPIISPFEGLTGMGVKALEGKPIMDLPEGLHERRVQGAAQVLDAAGIPTERFKEALEASDYPRLAGQGVGALTIGLLAHKAGKLFTGRPETHTPTVHPPTKPLQPKLDFGPFQPELPYNKPSAGMQVKTPFDERWPQGPMMARDPSVPETRWQDAGVIEGPEVGPYGITKDHPQLPLEQASGQSNLFGEGDMWGFKSAPLEKPPLTVEAPPVTSVPPASGESSSILPPIIPFRGKDKVDLAKLKALGYEPWPGHVDENGRPLLKLKGTNAPNQPAPTGQSAPDAEGNISFNADDGIIIPREDIDENLIEYYKKRGMILSDQDPVTGGGIFRRKSDEIAFEEVVPGDFSHGQGAQEGETTGRVAPFPRTGETLKNATNVFNEPEGPQLPSDLSRNYHLDYNEITDEIIVVDSKTNQPLFNAKNPSEAETFIHNMENPRSLDDELNDYNESDHMELPPEIEPTGDINALRTQSTLRPQMDPRMAARVEAGGPRMFDFSPPEAGQMELPWARGENPMPIDGDALSRHIQEGADQFTRPSPIEPQQKSLEDQMKDAEIAAYLQNEDATPPESIDLSQYGPDKVFDPNTDIAQAKVKGGGLKASMNVTRGIENLTKDYTSPLSEIMVREGMQNAMDAADKVPNGHVKVRIDTDNKAIEIHDNGAGMDENTLANKLVEVFSTGKEGDETATGGKGIGSASYIYGGKHFEIESVAIDPIDGRKYKIKAGGTPDQFFSERGSDWEKVEVPMDTPTGTTMRVTVRDDQNIYNAPAMLDKIVAHTRNRKSTVTYDRIGSSSNKGKHISEIEANGGQANTTQFKTSENDKVIGDFVSHDSEVKVQIPEHDESIANDTAQVHYLNNGMYQFTDNIYIDKPTGGYPPHVIVDIHPLVDETHDNYPFINTREDIKKDIRKDIKGFLEDKISGPAVTKRKNRTQELYDSMVEIPVQGTKRPFVIFDPGERLTPEEATHLRNSPIVHALAQHLDGLINDIVESTGRSRWSDRLERVGFVLDPGSHGIHVPNPATGKSTIGFNLFHRIESMKPKDAAFHATGTGLHEVGHIGTEAGEPIVWKESDFNHPLFGQFVQKLSEEIHSHGDTGFSSTGHDMGFVHRLGETYAAFGPEKTFDAAEKLRQLYTKGSKSGDYSPEIQELLRIYKESRGRVETTEDLLSRTGVKQANRTSSGEGLLPGNNRPDGTGTPPEQPGRKTFEQFLAEGKAQGEKEESLMQQWYDLSRGLTTTLDISAPMRQGLPLIATKAFWISWVPMVKALGSEKAFQKTLTDIKNRPLFQSKYNTILKKFIPSVADDAGVKMNDISTNLGRREESVASNWAESGGMLNKIPGAANLYKKTVGRGTRAANRAYTAYLNQLRADSFESLMTDAQKMSIGAIETGYARPGIMKQAFTPEQAIELDPFRNKKLAKELGDFINTATGRGPLKTQLPTLEGGKLGFKEQSLEKHATLLTNALFSPRLFASRVRMLNPATYMMASPMVRKQYLKAFLATAGAWGTVAGLAKMGGAEVSTDTNSADFGKIKIGNTRLDPAAGFQQYLVAASRLITGHTSSSATGKDFELGKGYRADTRETIGQRFMVNKLHPVVKFGYDLLNASERTPFHVMDRTAQLFVPLIIGDLTEIMKEDPSLLPLMAPVAAGMGTQTYDKGEAEGKFIPSDYDFNLEGGGLFR